MLTREQKEKRYTELREQLDGVETVFVMQNSGLSVNQVNVLRSEIRKIDATYKVFKNSVVRLAVEGTPLEPIGDGLTGPNSFAYTRGDSVELAKVLRGFVKEHEGLEFKRAYVEGQLLDESQAVKVADLPSKEELITRMLYLLQSPMRRLVTALNAPAQNLASVLQQIADSADTSDTSDTAEAAE
jgi:large subunit ribosomal protein L10